MKLFQYWDTGDPPDDVAACIESVRAINPEMDHQVFSRDDAAWFIGKRIGARHREAFLSLAVPAMQADYFRLCALWAKGGIYVDADTECTSRLKGLRNRFPGGFVTMWDRLLQNHFLMIPNLQNPFVGACLELATRHVEARQSDTAHNVTGPLVLNLIWSAVDSTGEHEDIHLSRDPAITPTPGALASTALFPGAAEALTAMTRRHELYAVKWFRRVENLAYKRTPLNWLNWDGSNYYAT